MTSISNVDLIMAALRARLQRLSKEKHAARSDRTAAPERKSARSEGNEIGNLQQLSRHEFDRALVELLLERELGEGLRADPRFKGLVGRISGILEDDPETQMLFRRAQQQATSDA